MSGLLRVLEAGPCVTVQDGGRPGRRAQGLSQGGAVDRLALAEGAALLGQPEAAALEMAAYGGVFSPTRPARVALTGAAMRVDLDGAPVPWNASVAVPAGGRLRVGAAAGGGYGYLHVGGGIASPLVLGARSAHVAAGLGARLAAGDAVALGRDATPDAPARTLEGPDREAGGPLAVVASLQTDAFPPETVARFAATTFRRDVRGDRMGVRLRFEGEGFHAPGGLSVVSEVAVPGDVQIAGDGAPFVLLAECQTTAGYPRIATIPPAALPRLVQARSDAPLRFVFTALAEAVAAEAAERRRRAALGGAVRMLRRDPADDPHLLGRQLISGVTAGEAG